MEKQYKTVVQGEASESDDDEEVMNDGAKNQEAPKAVVVEGEASESEEEELDSSGRPLRRQTPPQKLSDHSNSLDSIDEITGVPTLSLKHAWRPKYDTHTSPLPIASVSIFTHCCGWESNLSVCNNLNNMVSQAYLSAAKEINNCAQYVSKSHATIQDVSHHMRLMTNDSFNLHDTIDIIATCKLLPNIKMPVKPKSEPADAAATATGVSQNQESETAPQA